MPRDLLCELPHTLGDLGVPRGARVVAGVSGGADSLALARLLHAAGYALTVAYVHHGLRAESDAEAAFVEAWARRRGVACVVVRLDGDALRGETGGVQAAARRARYDALGAVAREHGAAYVAVGHHADDQAETALMRLTRGLGPDAPLGMRARRRLSASYDEVVLIRPLLQCRKHTLEGYLEENGETWAEDAGNADATTPRGRMRHRVLPALEDAVGAGGLLALARSVTLRSDSARRAGPDPGASVARPIDARAYWPRVTSVWIPPLPIDAVQSARGWLRSMFGADYSCSTRDLESVARLARAEVGKRLVWGLHTFWRERSGVVAIPAQPPPASFGPLAESSIHHDLIARVDLPDDFRRYAPATLCLDADALGGGLAEATVRPWYPGERIHPIGAAQPVKVASLLSRRATPVSHRAWVRVLEVGGHIAAVPGVEAAHFARVTSDTRRVLVLTVPPLPPI